MKTNYVNDYIKTIKLGVKYYKNIEHNKKVIDNTINPVSII